MTTIKTNLDNTEESARRIRFEPTVNIPATTVQKAIEQAANSAIDVFLIGGQSLAVGTDGDASLSPHVPVGKCFQYYNGVLSICNDPVGPSPDGSAWPSFALTYYAATGRKICLVPAGVGGTAQNAAAAAYLGSGTTHWDVGGTLFPASVNLANAALAALIAGGYSPVYRGVLWAQGNADVSAYFNGAITADQYAVSLVTMIARYRSATIGGTTYPSMPFYIFALGGVGAANAFDASDLPYQPIRAKQYDVEVAQPYTRVVFDNAVDFVLRGMMNVAPHNTEHYTQSGYNEMGRIGATNIVTGGAHRGLQSTGALGTPYGVWNSLYYTRGKFTLGQPTDGPSLLNVVARPDKNGLAPSTLRTRASVAAGTVPALILQNDDQSAGAGHRVALFMQPAWGTLGDTYGSVIYSEHDGDTGRGDIVFGGHSAGAFQEYGRWRYCGALRITPRTGTPVAVADGDLWVDGGVLKARLGGVTRALAGGDSGTWTPTIAPIAGPGGFAAGTASGRYRVVGDKLLWVSINVPITTAGTAVGLTFTFPSGFTAASDATLGATDKLIGLASQGYMVAYVVSGDTGGKFSPPGNAFTNGHSYNISGLIEIT
jgi:hypothetical protein